MNMEWLAYSLKEIVKKVKGRNDELEKLFLRIKHGVKEDLLELVKLPGIGRAKARKMRNAGITIKKLQKIKIETLAKIIGEKTAMKVLRSIHS